jgi:hypothetical protein
LRTFEQLGSKEGEFRGWRRGEGFRSEDQFWGGFDVCVCIDDGEEKKKERMNMTIFA